MLQLGSSLKKHVLQREQFSDFSKVLEIEYLHIGFNTCVRKLCELDAPVFQIINLLMHKYYWRLCYRGNNSCCLRRLKATGYVYYEGIPQTNNAILPYPKQNFSLVGKITCCCWKCNVSEKGYIKIKLSIYYESFKSIQKVTFYCNSLIDEQ